MDNVQKLQWASEFSVHANRLSFSATHKPKNLLFLEESVLTAYLQLRVRKLDVLFPCFLTGQSRCREYNAMPPINTNVQRFISEICKYCDNCYIPRCCIHNLKSAYRTKVIFASFDIKRTLLIMSPLFLVYISEH